MARAHLSLLPDSDPNIIEEVSICQKSAQKFADCSLIVAHSTVYTCNRKLPVKIVNPGEKAICLRKGVKVAILQVVACVGPVLDKGKPERWQHKKANMTCGSSMEKGGDNSVGAHPAL